MTNLLVLKNLQYAVVVPHVFSGEVHEGAVAGPVGDRLGLKRGHRAVLLGEPTDDVPRHPEVIGRADSGTRPYLGMEE